MAQPDIIIAIKLVAQVFEKLGIPYFIGGSVASSAYGMTRATLDVDVVAAIKPQQVQPLVNSLTPLYYMDQDIVSEAVNRRSSFNLIHLETMLKVDVFILHDEAYHQTAMQRRRKDTLDDAGVPTEFYFAAAEDVILSKLDWYRRGGSISEQQWRDVLGVLKVQQEMLDIVYLKTWAQTLKLADLLQQAFLEAGIKPHI
jgi:hypothetical protein